MEGLVCSSFCKKAFLKTDSHVRRSLRNYVQRFLSGWRHSERSTCPCLCCFRQLGSFQRKFPATGPPPVVSSSWPFWHSTASAQQSGKVACHSNASEENSTPATCSLQPTSTAEIWVPSRERMSNSPVRIVSVPKWGYFCLYLCLEGWRHRVPSASRIALQIQRSIKQECESARAVQACSHVCFRRLVNLCTCLCSAQALERFRKAPRLSHRCRICTELTLLVCRVQLKVPGPPVSFDSQRPRDFFRVRKQHPRFQTNSLRVTG